MSMLIGKTLKNRYRVEKILGHGGMAEVYEVYDLQRGVPLAMKVLREDLAEDRVFLRRFQREAQNLAKLQHPNIVRFYGLEQEGRLAFILMDYIEGTTLRGLIFDENGPLPDQKILDIMQPICSALNYAHQQGIVHCDLKSANIMLDKNGKVFLTDFGIARMTDTATSTMVGIGTPAYMAPELIKGLDPTPQSDIYSLGIVLYEMCTGGERPFTGERVAISGTTAEKVKREHLEFDPISIKKFNPAIRSKLESVVLKTINKQPEQRYGNALLLYSEIKNAIENNNQANYDHPSQPFESKSVEKSPIFITESQKISKWGKREFLFGLVGIGVLIFIIYSLLPLNNSGVTSANNFWVDDSEIAKGDCTYINWDVKKAQSVKFNHDRVDASGSKKVCPLISSTYLLEVEGKDNNTYEEYVSIRIVNELSHTLEKSNSSSRNSFSGIIDFWADDSEISSGDCTLINWKVNDAQSVKFNHDRVDLVGSKRVCPLISSTYLLEVERADGHTYEKKISIDIVNSSNQALTKKDSSTVNKLSSSIDFWLDDSEIFLGDCTQINWIVENAKSVKFNREHVDFVDSKKICPLISSSYLLEVKGNDDSLYTKDLSIRVNR